MQVHNFEYAGSGALQAELASRGIPDGENVLIQCFVGKVDKDAIIDLQQSFRECLPNSHLIGATSAGGIIEGKFAPQNPVVSISVFDKATVTSSFVKESDEVKMTERVAKETIRNNSKLMILFSDGLSTNGDTILQNLYPLTNDLMVAGGRAGDGAFKETYIFDNESISDVGAVAACVNGDVTVINRYFLNWQPIGKIMTITGVDGNILKTINHLPVRDIYRKYLGDYVGDNLPVSNTEFPLIKIGPNGQQVARAIIAMTDEDHAVLGGNLEVGDQVQFSYGNVDMILDETEKSISELSLRKPEAVFAYSCAARLGFLGDDVGMELGHFNNLAPSAGFFTFGEYYYSGSSYEMLNGTLTVVGLTEQDVSDEHAEVVDGESQMQESPATRIEDEAENVFQSSQSRVLQSLINLSNTVTEELVETHREIDTILDNMPAIVFLRDSQGRFIHINKSYQDQYGLDQEAIAGKTLSEIFPAELADKFIATDQELFEAGKNIEKEYALKKDGEETILSSNMFPVFNEAGEISAYGGVEVDVTERRVAELKLRDAYSVISSSINYASRIQRSVLPDTSFFSSLFSDHFVLWEPRDVVGGDIYWSRMWGDGFLMILGDCTGHGVPGAFMTLIATGALDNALTEVPYGKVGLLLQRMHQLVQITLGQHGSSSESDDGLELGLCYIGPELLELTFCGARFELYQVEKGEVSVVKGTKSGIGYKGIPLDQEFEEHQIGDLSNKAFYMTSDGLIDQVGGEKHRMYGKKRFRELLLEIQKNPMSEQKDIILQALTDFQNDEERRDDVSLIGFKI